MKLIKSLLLAACLCFTALAQAQGPIADKNKLKVIGLGLYPPDLIMRHQQQLDITDGQRSTISQAVTAFQSEVSELQWNLQNGQQLLKQSLETSPINLEDSLAQAESVLAMESSFKLAHFRLLITIKNTLTDEQVATIDGLIKEKRGSLRK